MQLFVSDVCLGALAEVSGTLGTSARTIQPVQIQKSEVNAYKRDIVSGVCSLLTCNPEDKIEEQKGVEFTNISIFVSTAKEKKTPH